MEIGSAISVIKDPFNQESMNCFRVSCRKWMGKWSYRGTVEFENGNTKAEQDFESEDLESLLKKMEAFVKELK